MNIFFIFISSILLSILFLFNPSEFQEKDHTDIALFNIYTFTMYEFDKNGLLTIINGEDGTRYKDRYEIKDINYTDNSQKFSADMKANHGTYKNEVVNLDGDVVYIREDGFTFESQEAVYNTKTSIAKVDQDFVLYQDKNNVEGSSLVYNNKLNKTEFSNVIAKYQINKVENEK
jgi:LPS export ABC transporter protein LptC